jgi:hypothetical protein
MTDKKIHFPDLPEALFQEASSVGDMVTRL